MPNYEVTLVVVTTEQREVNASSAEEAADMAVNNSDKMFIDVYDVQELDGDEE